MSADYASTTTYAVSGPADGLEDWIGSSVEVDAPYPIEAGRVADFCSLIEDANPVYWDTALATARFGGPVAPPAMLSGARFPAPWRPDGRPENGPVSAIQVPLPSDTLINAGFNCWYEAPIRVGDRLTYSEEIKAISDRKQTSLGSGWFVTTKCDVTNQERTPIAGYENIMLRYTSDGEGDGEPKAAAPFVPPASEDGVPAISVPVTYTLCALVVAGTRDYFPGHHDPDYARAQGVAGVYPNTGFYCGLIDRVALEWAEYAATIKRRNLRMFKPAPVGETLRTGGRVIERRDDDGPVVELQVDVFTDAALIAQASVTIRLHEEYK